MEEDSTLCYGACHPKEIIVLQIQILPWWTERQGEDVLRVHGLESKSWNQILVSLPMTFRGLEKIFHKIVGKSTQILCSYVSVWLCWWSVYGSNRKGNTVLMVFPVVMYGCESWTMKKAEHQRIDAFELWCCRRLLRVPWTARRSNQSILKEISPEYSSEGLMLKLKLQYFCPPDVKNWLIGKDPDAGKDWRREEKGATEDEVVGCHHQLNGHEFE